MTFTFDPSSIDELERDADFLAAFQAIGDDIADRAADGARKDSGEGAASIHAELTEDESGGVCVDVSWDQAHFYMGFTEVGTEKVPARPFLRPALDSTRL